MNCATTTILVHDFMICSISKVQHACWGQSRSKRREKANAIISQIVNVALEAALFSVLSEEGQLGQRDCFASHRRSLGAVFSHKDSFTGLSVVSGSPWSRGQGKQVEKNRDTLAMSFPGI